MKIISLVPVGYKESYSLYACLESLKPISDEIIVLYDGDIDKDDISVKFSEKFTDKIYFNKHNIYNFNSSKLRNKLLSLGRKHDGTHYIFLDADEAFSNNFIKYGRKLISKLERGQKYFMKWVSMWKSYNYYRSDNKSIWSPKFKDFIVCDDFISNFNEDIKFHESRTFGSNDSAKYINEDKGYVLHYQFSNWDNFLNKQSYYMLREIYNIKKETISQINRKYFFSFFEFNPQVKEVSKNDYEHLNLDNLKKIVSYNHNNYWKKILYDFLKNKDLKKISNLNIWNSKICFEFYLKEVKKKPNLNFFEKIKLILYFMKFNIINIFKK